MKAIIITTALDHAPFMHDEGGPLLSSLGLNAIPKLMFNRFSCVREVKKPHCLEMEAGAIRALRVIDCNNLVPK
jgi:hypothetical protein